LILAVAQHDEVYANGQLSGPITGGARSTSTLSPASYLQQHVVARSEDGIGTSCASPSTQ